MAAQVLPLPVLQERLPPAPPPELDPYLDAAARCFARHGIARTSVQDVARDMGINRATVYRKVGTVDDMVRLLAARELYALTTVVAGLELKADTGPAVVVRLVATVVRHARNHPVMRKVLTDEPELIGPFLITYLPDAVRQVAERITPALKWAQRNGALARRDPTILAEWVVRIAASLILDPLPDDEVESFLSEVLTPALKKERR
ncbi:MAG TPA: TetR/AcrR family transcriptional regulator [Acidimicrobiales bacterium]|nr:TetR/AcrR family transcriptional regulator [Acidimicrobiales bacterium]